tara:strand:- start:1067 stop:2419 length:1353 start_codon:yes stop_codon:yes gene_type:complete
VALITDPDDLNQNTEITIDTSAKTIELTVAGNLSNDGVTGQAFYSFLKEEWKDDSNLIPYAFPMLSITPEQFEFIEDWVPANDTTRNLIRSAGWREITASDVLEREYMGIISLGEIDSSNTPYYAFSSDTAKTDFDFSGEINQAIQTYGDASNGNFDKRSDSLTTYIRSQGNTYDSATSESIGLTALNYIANRFPLAEDTDLKISASDSDIQNNAPYTGMSIRFYPSAQTRTIGGVSYNFGVIIDGNNGTAEQIYEFVQYQLRQSTDIDIDAGQVNIGNLQDEMLEFVGDTLKTKLVNNGDGGGGGVYIDDYNSNDINRLVFVDSTGTERSFPFVASGNLVLNSNLANDSSAIYRMFFTSSYGTSSAIIVDDNDGTDISGTVSGQSTIAFTFDYDGNTQGGRTAGTDANVTVVAIGLNTAQYVSATATLTRSTGQNISLVAPLERNYSNP